MLTFHIWSKYAIQGVFSLSSPCPYRHHAVGNMNSHYTFHEFTLHFSAPKLTCLNAMLYRNHVSRTLAIIYHFHGIFNIILPTCNSIMLYVQSWSLSHMSSHATIEHHLHGLWHFYIIVLFVGYGNTKGGNFCSFRNPGTFVLNIFKQ